MTTTSPKRYSHTEINQMTVFELVEAVEQMDGWPHKDQTIGAINNAPNLPTARAQFKIAYYRNLEGVTK